MKPPSGSYDQIFAVVRRIPRGRVATYGQIASLAGLAGHARQVGYALSSLDPERAVPWHRVINAKGRVSPRAEWGGDQIQHQLLAAEGIALDADGIIDLARYQWRPRTGGVHMSGIKP